MDVNKAIKKQKKSYKRFMLLMSFIFFSLPIILINTKSINVFFLIYLIVIEVLIVLAVVVRKNNETLKFYYNKDKLKIDYGVMRNKLNIVCKKVVLIHVENIIRKTDRGKDFIIIILIEGNFRNRRMVPVNSKFLENHPSIIMYYNKMKKLKPESYYMFTLIKKGFNYKYILLDTIYRSCVYAKFTEDAIEKIKEYREGLNE